MIPVCLFLLLLSVYLRLLAPGTYWKDAAEFIAMAYRLSITHPPGHSTSCLLFSAFRYLPVGPFAFKVNLVCATSLALSTTLFFEACRTLLNRKFRVPWGIATASALPFALVVGLGRDLVAFATTAEVYCVFLFLLFAGLLAFCKGKHPLESCLLMIGLAAGCHLKAFLFLPCVLVALWHKDRWIDGSRALRALGLLGIGGMVFLFMPIRSGHHPFIDWDTTSELRGLIRHMTTHQFRYALALPSLPDWIWGLRVSWESFWNTLSPMVWPLSLAGFALLVRRRRFLPLWILAVVLLELLYGFAVNFWGIEYKEAWHVTFFLGAGLASFCVAMARDTLGSGKARRVFFVLLCLLPCWVFVKGFIFLSRRHSITAEDFSLRIKKSMDERCFAVLPAGTLGFQFWELQQVEGRMESSRFLCREGLKWYGQVSHLERDWQFPFTRLAQAYDRLPAQEKRTSWDRWVAGQAADLYAEQEGRSCYWMIDGQEGSSPLAGRIVANALIGEIVGFPVKDPLLGRPYESLWAGWLDDGQDLLRHFCDEHAVREISAVHNAFGIFLANARDFPNAQAAFQRAQEFDFTRAGALALSKTEMNLGILLSLMGEYEKAEQQMLKACSTYAGSADIYFWLGELAGRRKDLVKAQEMWRKGLRLNPEHPGCRQRIGSPSL